MMRFPHVVAKSLGPKVKIFAAKVEKWRLFAIELGLGAFF
jgi:hypothetical protein